jgi:hypothetical protein
VGALQKGRWTQQREAAEVLTAKKEARAKCGAKTSCPSRLQSLQHGSRVTLGSGCSEGLRSELALVHGQIVTCAGPPRLAPSDKLPDSRTFPDIFVPPVGTCRWLPKPCVFTESVRSKSFSITSHQVETFSRA